MCEYSIRALEDYDWNRNKVVVRKERLKEIYGQLMFASAFCVPRKGEGWGFETKG